MTSVAPCSPPFGTLGAAYAGADGHPGQRLRSFDRLVDPTDEHRLHDSDWATHRVAWEMKLAIVGGVNKAPAAVAAPSRASPAS